MKVMKHKSCRKIFHGRWYHVRDLKVCCAYQARREFCDLREVKILPYNILSLNLKNMAQNRDSTYEIL